MKTQTQAIDSRSTQTTESDHRSEKASNYPSANKIGRIAPDYNSMAMEVQLISHPMSFEDLKSFYHISKKHSA